MGFVNKVSFYKSIATPNDFPNNTLPEIAFIGKSNVGKSSCIASILGNKKLVKVSKKPGATKYINYYLVNESFYLVDFPGYGFSRAPKAIHQSYEELAHAYCKRPHNVVSFLLLDSRRSLDERDIAGYNFLNVHKKNIVFIITKTDRLSKSSVLTYAHTLTDYFFVHTNKIIFFSSKTGFGKKEIENIILKGLENRR